MRQIIFRGKEKELSEWIEGLLVIRGGKVYIDYEFKMLPGIYEPREVFPESVGQYIGVDLKGEKIFEGTWLKFRHQESSFWEVSDVQYQGDKGASYPSFELNREQIKEHYFEGNVISEIMESDFEVQIVGNVFEKTWEEVKKEVEETKC